MPWWKGGAARVRQSFSGAPVSLGPHSPGARPSERLVVALVLRCSPAESRPPHASPRRHARVRCTTRLFHQEMFGTIAAHNCARQVVDCCHPTTGNGWVGSGERIENQKSLILVQLGRRLAHDSPTSPFGGGIHVGDVEQ